MSSNKNIQSIYESSILKEVRLTFGPNNIHLNDDILSPISVENLQDVLYSNIPKDKLNERVVMKELDALIRSNVADARGVAKKIASDLVKDLMMSEAAGDKSSFECMECGAKFKKKIGKGEVKCPKCKSTDVEVD